MVSLLLGKTSQLILLYFYLLKLVTQFLRVGKMVAESPKPISIRLVQKYWQFLQFLTFQTTIIFAQTCVYVLYTHKYRHIYYIHIYIYISLYVQRYLEGYTRNWKWLPMRREIGIGEAEVGGRLTFPCISFVPFASYIANSNTKKKFFC